jgi:hypothetical protein
MLAVKCLNCLNQSLKQNICNLDINKPFSLSHEYVPIHDSLRYSCMHWASHLEYALQGASGHGSVDVVHGLLSKFVDEHLLHWFECLSALRELELGVKSLERASEVTSVSTKLVGNQNIE